MPTYEYECGACGHRFDHYQSISSRKLRRCPACGKSRLARLLGAGAGLIFRGSGFYETDYKRARGGKPADASASPGTEKATKPPAETPAAPAPAPAPKPKSKGKE